MNAVGCLSQGSLFTAASAQIRISAGIQQGIEHIGSLGDLFFFCSGFEAQGGFSKSVDAQPDESQREIHVAGCVLLRISAPLGGDSKRKMRNGAQNHDCRALR